MSHVPYTICHAELDSLLNDLRLDSSSQVAPAVFEPGPHETQQTQDLQTATADAPVQQASVASWASGGSAAAQQHAQQSAAGPSHAPSAMVEPQERSQHRQAVDAVQDAQPYRQRSSTSTRSSQDLSDTGTGPEQRVCSKCVQLCTHVAWPQHHCGALYVKCSSCWLTPRCLHCFAAASQVAGLHWQGSTSCTYTIR